MKQTTTIEETLILSQFQDIMTRAIIKTYEVLADYVEQFVFDDSFTASVTAITDSATDLYGQTISYAHFKNFTNEMDVDSDTQEIIINSHLKLAGEARVELLDAINKIDTNNQFYNLIKEPVEEIKEFFTSQPDFPKLHITPLEDSKKQQIISQLKDKTSLHQITRLLDSNNYFNSSIVNQHLVAYILDFNIKFSSMVRGFKNFNQTKPKKEELKALAASLSRALSHYMRADELLAPQQLIIFTLYHSLYTGDDLTKALSTLQSGIDKLNVILKDRQGEDLAKAAHLSMYQYMNLDKEALKAVNL